MFWERSRLSLETQENPKFPVLPFSTSIWVKLQFADTWPPWQMSVLYRIFLVCYVSPEFYLPLRYFDMLFN